MGLIEQAVSELVMKKKPQVMQPSMIKKEDKKELKMELPEVDDQPDNDDDEDDEVYF